MSVRSNLTSRPSRMLLLLLALSAAGAATAAGSGQSSSRTAHVAALSVVVKVDGKHITATPTPADTTLGAIAFPKEGSDGTTLERQADGSLMAALAEDAPKTLAVVVSAVDHTGKRQETCVMPIDHGGSCKIDGHLLHIHTVAGHEYQIARKPG